MNIVGLRPLVVGRRKGEQNQKSVNSEILLISDSCFFFQHKSWGVRKVIWIAQQPTDVAKSSGIHVFSINEAAVTEISWLSIKLEMSFETQFEAL